MGKDKYMDGFKYDVPAEKLGYIQRLGAGRMAPGKKADLTAMKMMHGDAAAKYYDGAGMYMNGAPKYEGASKSYMGPMTDGHGGAAGHTHAGGDRPSYTEQNTSQVVVPGTKSSTDTSSSNSSQSKTKLEKAKSGTKTKQSASDYMTSLSKNKKFSGRTGAEMAEAGHISTSNAGAYDKIAGTSSSGGSTSSSSSTKTSTEPSVKTVVKKEKKTSKNKGASELLSAGEENERNRRNRYSAGQDERMNIAKRDSATVAQKYMKNRPVNEANLLQAVQRGNEAGRRTLVSRQSNPSNSFGEGMGEFRFTRDQSKDAFSSDIGRGNATVTSGRGSKASTGDDITVSRTNGPVSRGGRLTSSDVGSDVRIGKKGRGSATINSVNFDAGSAGSYGGFRTPQEYLSGGTPKMPKGPMKFGMGSSAPGKHIDGTNKGHKGASDPKPNQKTPGGREERPVNPNKSKPKPESTKPQKRKTKLEREAIIEADKAAIRIRAKKDSAKEDRLNEQRKIRIRAKKDSAKEAKKK